MASILPSYGRGRGSIPRMGTKLNIYMPYMNKKQMDELTSKVEEILENFSIPHYYKSPNEKQSIQLTTEILDILKLHKKYIKF